MPYIQNHSLLEPLKKIDRHDQLPVDATALFELTCEETTKTYTVVNHEAHLKVLKSFILPLVAGPKYCCHQYDFPLRALSWFPATLEAFRNGVKFEGVGGGGMTTPELEVDGEYLSVSRHTTGYTLANWSRNVQQNLFSDYEPMFLNFEEAFLYKNGFLAVWQEFGGKFERGQI